MIALVGPLEATGYALWLLACLAWMLIRGRREHRRRTVLVQERLRPTSDERWLS